MMEVLFKCKPISIPGNQAIEKELLLLRNVSNTIEIIAVGKKIKINSIQSRVLPSAATVSSS